jgi:hypothetical protein
MKQVFAFLAFGVACVALLAQTSNRPPVAPATSDKRLTALTRAQDYYAKWIGVRAPDFGAEVFDRLGGREISIHDFKGRRLLLYSFDAGDFVNLPDHNSLLAELEALNHVLHDGPGTNIAVIGFTYGISYFLPDARVPARLQELSKFPIVNLTHTGRDLSQPYRILSMPSGILIDRNGVIVDIVLQPMDANCLRQVAEEPDWNKPVARAPVIPPPDMATLVPREMPAWTVYVFGQDLASGTVFRRSHARVHTVYDKTAIPDDAVERLKEVEGKLLKHEVKQGAPLRKSQFN